MERRARHVAVVLLTLTMVVGATGCGAADKLARARSVRAAHDRLVAAGTISGTLLISGEVIEAGLGALPSAPASVAQELRIEMARARAELGATKWSEDVVYARRGESGGSRPWAKLRLGDRYDDRDNLAATAFGSTAVLNPIYALQALRGALSGSIEQKGSEDLGGVTTNRIAFRFAFDKAFDGADDRRREGVITALALMGAPFEKVMDGEVWLAPDGTPRRVALGVRVDRGRRERTIHHMRFDLTELGGPIEVRLPLKGEIAAVDTVDQILGNAPAQPGPDAPDSAADATVEERG